MYYKYGQRKWIKDISLKKRTCCFFDDIINIDDFNIAEKSCKNILVYNISYTTWLIVNFYVLDLMN